MTATTLASPLGDVAFTEADFTAIVAMVRQHSGIVPGASKRDLVYGRLRRRLRALRVNSFTDYRKLLDGPGAATEREQMINAITTNLTGFFREAHHFAHLAGEVLPLLSSASRRLRIWSAGCSSGEEPYTIAMTLRGTMPDLDAWDARILATDIDTNMLAHAAVGRYAAERVAAVPSSHRRDHLLPCDDGLIAMSPRLQTLITFRPLNLLEAWPMRGPFDAIFCRNVIIYFDKATQRVLFDRFAELLAPRGHLYVGPS